MLMNLDVVSSESFLSPFKAGYAGTLDKVVKDVIGDESP